MCVCVCVCCGRSVCVCVPRAVYHPGGATRTGPSFSLSLLVKPRERERERERGQQEFLPRVQAYRGLSGGRRVPIHRDHNIVFASRPFRPFSLSIPPPGLSSLAFSKPPKNLFFFKLVVLEIFENLLSSWPFLIL